MKYVLYAATAIYCICISTTVMGQTGWKWGIASGITSPNTGYQYMCGSIDKSSNIIIAGVISGRDTVTIGTESFMPFGTAITSIVISEADSSGHFLWSLMAQDTFDAYPISVAADAARNVYLFGFYWGDTLKFGRAVLTSASVIVPTYFLAKISPTGTLIWAKKICSRGTGSVLIPALGQDNDFGCMAIDTANNIYLSGSFDSTVTFGATTMTVSAGPLVHNEDIFVARFDSAGNPVWAKQIGGNKNETSNGMTIASDGAIYVSCVSNSTLITVAASSITPTDIVGGSLYMNFLVKLDTAGNEWWAKKITGHLGIGGLAAGTSGDFYLDGAIDSTVTLGTAVITSYDSHSFVLAKYDSSGSVLWAKTAKYMYDTYVGPHSIAIDGCGNAWVAISSDTTEDIEGYLLHSSVTGTEPLVMAEFDDTGQYLQSMIQNSGGDTWSDIMVDAQGDFYLAGTLNRGTDYFGPDSLSSPSWMPRSFVARYRYNTTGTCAYAALEVPQQHVPASESELKLSPNPARNTLSVQSSEPITTITITDLMGQTICSQLPPANCLLQTIDVSAYPAGMYLVRINSREVRKWVKE